MPLEIKIEKIILNAVYEEIDLQQWHLLSLDVVREVNKIPWARLTFKDGDFGETHDFAHSSYHFFKLGTTIKIKAKEDTLQDITLFTGFVVRHSIKADLNNSLLIIELKDKAFQMTRVRRNEVHKPPPIRPYITDNNIISNIIAKQEYNLPQPLIRITLVKHKEILQYYCTDWDFILSRAEANGHWIMINDGHITSLKPTVADNEVKTFSYADENSTIFSFHMELDGRHHYNSAVNAIHNNSVKGKYYNIAGQDIGNQDSDDAFQPIAGNNKFNDAVKNAHTLGGSEFSLINPVPGTDNEAKAWANAHMRKTRLSLFKGRIRFKGAECIRTADNTQQLKLGDTIKLEDIASRFNGKTLITGIRHQITLDGWFADVQFGMSAEWFTEDNKDIVAPPAGGLLPAINGLHIGKVVDPGVDNNRQNTPAGHYKVKVKIPGMDNEGHNIIWARMASPYAGGERGIFFRPEVGDEVVLGFLNDDPRHAIIMGSLHSQNRKPPFLNNNDLHDGNKIKGIKTKNGLSIEFDDDGDNDRTIEIKAASGNGRKIVIKTSDNNFLEISEANGIYIKSNNSELKIKDAEIDIHTQSGKKVKINGMAVKK